MHIFFFVVFCTSSHFLYILYQIRNTTEKTVFLFTALTSEEGAEVRARALGQWAGLHRRLRGAGETAKHAP